MSILISQDFFALSKAIRKPMGGLHFDYALAWDQNIHDCLNLTTLLTTDPTGMDTYLEGEAAQQFFRTYRENANLNSHGWNIDLSANGLDNLAGGFAKEFGGNNFKLRAVLPVFNRSLRKYILTSYTLKHFWVNHKF